MINNEQKPYAEIKPFTTKIYKIISKTKIKVYLK